MRFSSPVFVLPLMVAATVFSPGLASAERIVYESSGDIWLLDSDNSKIQLTSDPLPESDPALSHDGLKVVFKRQQGSFLNFSLWKIDLNTDGTPVGGFGEGNGVEIASLSGNHRDPSWSHDDTKIAFAFKPASGTGTSLDIFKMNADGSGRTRLTGNAGEDNAKNDQEPSWSPDDSQIVFRSIRDGDNEIYKMAANGLGLVNLSANAASDYSPVWSPDGTKIAFSSDRSGTEDVWVMDVSGTNPVQLTASPPTTPYTNNRPTWRSDGQKLAFTSDRSGDFEIFTMDANGSNQTNVTNSPTTTDQYPDWGSGGTPPLPFFSINNVTVTEGDSGTATATFSVTLSEASDQTTTVEYASSDGTATVSDNDYSLTGIQTLTFAPGITAGTVAVAVTGDMKNEVDETFKVTLANPSVGTALGKSIGIGTILNDDALPSLSINNVTLNPEGNALSTNVTFTVSLSAVSGKTVTASFGTANGSATASNDYVGISGTITIPAGQTSGSITVNVKGDTTFESDETFSVVLSAAVNATISTNVGQGTIVNDDNPPTVSIANASLNEGNASGAIGFVVSLSQISGQDMAVQYNTADVLGGATAPADYTAQTTKTLTILAGQLTGTISVPIVNDNVDEGNNNETFIVTLSNATGATLNQTQGTGTIADDDVATLSINNALSLVEGNTGAKTAAFTVTLSTPRDQAVTVDYATSDGTAKVADNDYTPLSTTIITFTPGQTTKSLTVQIAGDTLNEDDETFFVNLTNASVTVTANQGSGTILNDDAAPTLSISNATSISEGNSSTTDAVFQVTLSAASGKTITVNYATADGTATTPADYQTATGTITFAPGEATKPLTIKVVGDTLNEDDETFFVNLTNASVAVTANQGSGTILNDDVAPTLSISNVTPLAEGNSGTTNAVFQVTLSAASGKNVLANYTTADGTAKVADNDYLTASDTLIIPAGQIFTTIVVKVMGDVKDENNEKFQVNLSSVVNAIAGDLSGEATIVDDDTSTLSITNGTNGTVAEGNNGTSNLPFTVTLSTPSSKTVTVAYGAVSGTTNPATVSSDFLSTKGNLTFAPGDTTKTVNVPIVGDYVPEADETFFVKLSSPVNAAISAGQDLGTITNDDFDTTPPTVSFTTSATAPVGTTPASGSNVYNNVPAITGVAADAGSGVAKVTLRLYRATATAGVFEYWNGTSWITPGGTVVIPTLNTVLNPAAGSANVSWNKSGGWPTGSNLADGTYYLSVSAYDRAGKMASSSRNFKKFTDAVVPTVSFTTSTTTPVGTTPASGATISSPMPTITGVAADGISGVARVDLRLYRVTATAGVYEYWNGTNWITPGGAVVIPTLAATLNPATGGANVSWSKSSGWPTGAAFADGTYYLSATAYDRGANTATSSRNFRKVTAASAPIPTSVSGAASVSASSITLNFTGAVPAGDFTVAINDAATPVQNVERNGQTVTLLLLDGAMQIGDDVRVTWDGGSIQIAAE